MKKVWEEREFNPCNEYVRILGFEAKTRAWWMCNESGKVLARITKQDGDGAYRWVDFIRQKTGREKSLAAAKRIFI